MFMEQAECLAELSNVHKRYDKTVALDGFDLQVGPGELVAVLGPNGAGKTTAISLMLGLERPDSGAARLFGVSPHVLEARRRIGVMMQEVFLANELKVSEHIDLVSSYYPDPLPTDEVLEVTRTQGLAKRFYGVLSGGQKRQAQFAMAVCGRPELLFLDEPTVGLDLSARETMWQALRQLIARGASIVLTTHYLEEAEALADRVVVLSKGKMIAMGTVDEIRSLVVTRCISCTTSLSTDLIATWPEVDAVTRDRNKTLITANQAEAVVRRLVNADHGLCDLEVRRAGLAEAFTELIQEVEQ